LSGNEKVFRDSASAVIEFAPLADALLDCENPGDHNEAMMELGATVCSRRSPRCLFCPVKDFCAARARGIEEMLPKFPPKKMKKIEVDRLWMRCRDGIWLVRHATGTRRLKDLCEFPRLSDFSVPAKTVLRWKRIFEGKRGIADETITERFLLVPENETERVRKMFSSPDAEIFVGKVECLEELTFSGPHRKWLRELLKISS
jgi:A/G-specific adenine glycosylase